MRKQRDHNRGIWSQLKGMHIDSIRAKVLMLIPAFATSPKRTTKTWNSLTSTYSYILASIHIHNIRVLVSSAEIVISSAWKLRLLSPAPATSFNVSECMQVQDVIVEVVEGDARNVLCEAVEKHHASILVVGSHGYGAIKRYWSKPLFLFLSS